MKSVIIGAGTYGEVYLAYLREAGTDVVGFLDDAEEMQGKLVRGVPAGTAAASFFHKNLRVSRGGNLVAFAAGAPAERSAA